MKIVAKSLAVLGLMTGMVAAQSMEETLKKMGKAAGKAYVAPIVSGFGSNLNAGWYHKAPAPKKFGFHVEAGAVFMGTMLKGGSKTLDVAGEMPLDSTLSAPIIAGVDNSQGLRDSLRNRLAEESFQVRFSGPTIIGSDEDELQLVFQGRKIATGIPAGQANDSITVPTEEVSLRVTGILGDFADIPLPLFAPQLTLGTIYGTNLTLRWLPETETNEDIGAVKFFGFGVQHNPGVWLGSKLPVDLSVGYFTQTLEVGTLFKATSQAYGLNASKTLGWRFLNVTPYGGFQLESSSFDFAYDLVLNEGKPNESEEEIKFNLKGENKYRTTAGVSLRLLAININADYNFAKYNSFSAGIMVGI